MDIQSFLARVLPREGNGTYIGYTAFERGDDAIKYNKGANTLFELAKFCHDASAKRQQAYFALATYQSNQVLNQDGRVKWERKAAQAAMFKTLAIDIDCGHGKPYATQRDGAVALVEYLRKSGMPQPMMVSSGYGLHVYWPLTAVITKHEWLTVSTVLRASCAYHGLHIDTSKVNDPSMVLRPVGTYNFKSANPAPVRVLYDAPDNVPAALVSILNANTPLDAIELASKPTKNTKVDTSLTGMASAFLAGTATNDGPPADPGRIISRCAQVAHITRENGRYASEPEWYAVLGVASACEYPEDVAIEWSRGHDDYTEEATIAKLEQWEASTTGPATCARFSALAPERCKGCKYAGSVTTPVTLGKPEPKAISQEVVASGMVATPEKASITAPPCDPQDPFRRTEQGIVAMFNDVAQLVCPYDLFPVRMVEDPASNCHYSVWMWKPPHAPYRELRLRNSHIYAETKELHKVLADSGLLIDTKEKQGLVAVYMRGYMSKLQEAQKTDLLYTSFGWKNEGKSFVLGSTEYSVAAGKAVGHEVGVAKNIADKRLDVGFRPVGDPSLWVRCTKFLDAPGMEGHQFMLGVGFAAPLVQLTNLSGFCVSMLGPTGTGKTTMQKWITSIYGNPNQLMMKKEDTKLSFVQRMGMLANLPLSIDEATLMAPETLSDILYWATQGQDKNRATESVALTWALPVTLSTNKSLRNKIAAHVPDTDAVNMRMLEFEIPANKVFNEMKGVGRMITDVVMNNYGGVGREYIKRLVEMGEPTLRKLVVSHIDTLEQEYGISFDGAERYWMTAIVLADLGNKIAFEAGLIQYDYKRGTAWAIKQIKVQRNDVKETIVDAYDMLNQFVSSNLDKTITLTFYANGNKVSSEPPRSALHIRKEIMLGEKGEVIGGSMQIDREALRLWLLTKNYDYKRVIDVLTEDNVGTSGVIVRAVLGRGTPIKTGQGHVVSVDLSKHERLRCYLVADPLPANIVPISKAVGAAYGR